MIVNKQLCILLMYFSINAIAQEDVYRWVDENGNVHYADQPRSDKAKRFNPRQFNKSDPVASQSEVEANNAALSSINTIASETNLDQTPENEASDLATAQAEIPADTCQYLKDQMAEAQLALNSNNPSRVRQARIYLDTADKMLAQSNCG